MSVLVLGMHRSGTSLLTGCLEQMGLSTGSGPMMPAQPSNPRGFWENLTLTDLNDELLEALQGDWRSPPAQLIGERWWHSKALNTLRARAAQGLDDTFRDTDWVWKDPRTCLTLPFWLDLLDQMPCVVYIFRHPLAVWRSLDARDSVAREEALALWEYYVRLVLRQLKGLAVVVVHHQDLFADPVRELDRVAKFLSDRGVALTADSRAAVAATFDKKLDHWTDQETQGISGSIARLWDEHLGFELEYPSFPRKDLDLDAVSASLGVFMQLRQSRHADQVAELDQQLKVAAYQLDNHVSHIVKISAQINSLNASIERLNSEVEELGERVRDREALLQEAGTYARSLEGSLESLQSSRSYRVGCLMTAPARRVRRMLRRDAEH